jgi:Bacteriophage probable baseplate hub protein
MTPETATKQPGLPENYYAPQFRIEVEGKELGLPVMADIRDVKVVLDIDNVSTAEMTVNNYDDKTFELKWSDSDLFSIGNRVHVRGGYADRVVSMLRGTIETLSPVFLSDGSPTMTVRAFDGLKALKESGKAADNKPFYNKQDWQIVKAVGERHKLQLDRYDEGPVHKVVVQGKQDDLRFLKERAFKIGFELYMQTNPKTGKDGLHFVKRDGSGAKPRIYELAWGTLRNSGNTTAPPSLIEFKPTITLSRQVQSVTVRGWDVKDKKAISYTAKPETSNVKGKAGSGPATAGRVAGGEGKKEVVIDAPVSSVEEAKALAEALLRDRAYEFLTATGKTIGLPNLRPSDKVEIHGVGKRFGGTYYVTKVTHTLGSSGYVTEFDVCRTHDGKTHKAESP